MAVKFTYLPEINGECMSDINDAIQKTIASSSYIGGEDIRIFENTFAQYTGADDCCACSSGSSALHLAIDAILQNNDDIVRMQRGLHKRFVITTPLSFISTTEAIINSGLIPIMASVDISGNIDPHSVHHILEKYQKYIGGIVFTNMYGHVAEREHLRKLADQYGVFLVEDAAQSFGVSGLGQIADISCVSFNPVKNLGALGDAGALFGDNQLMKIARSAREHGVIDKNIFNRIGFNYRMDNMQANILMAKLPYLKGWNEHRKNVAAIYDSEISSYFYERPIPTESVYHLYNIMVGEIDHFMAHMDRKGIEVKCHYPATIPSMYAYDAPSLVRLHANSAIIPTEVWGMLRDVNTDNRAHTGLHSGRLIASKNVSLPIPFGNDWDQKVEEVIAAIKDWFNG